MEVIQVPQQSNQNHSTMMKMDPTSTSYYDNGYTQPALDQVVAPTESPVIHSNGSTPLLGNQYSSGPETNLYYPTYPVVTQNYSGFQGNEQTPYSYGFNTGGYGKSSLGVGGSLDVVHGNLLVQKPGYDDVVKDKMVASKPVIKNEAKKVRLLFFMHDFLLKFIYIFFAISIKLVLLFYVNCRIYLFLLIFVFNTFNEFL